MKKRISLLMALILFIACLSGVVNATEYIVKMSLTSDSYLVPGDTVVVNLKISEIDLGDGISEGDGISGIQAVLEYDENVFEEVTEDSFEGMNGWNNLMYYQEMVTAYRNDQVALPNDLLTITLKVKDSASVDSTSIKLKEIIASGTIGTGLQFKPTGDIEVEDVTVTIDKRVSNPRRTYFSHYFYKSSRHGNGTAFSQAFTKRKSLVWYISFLFLLYS